MSRLTRSVVALAVLADCATAAGSATWTVNSTQPSLCSIALSGGSTLTINNVNDVAEGAVNISCNFTQAEGGLTSASLTATNGLWNGSSVRQYSINLSPSSGVTDLANWWNPANGDGNATGNPADPLSQLTSTYGPAATILNLLNAGGWTANTNKTFFIAVGLRTNGTIAGLHSGTVTLTIAP